MQRVLWSAIASAALFTLIAARWLTPAPSGVGTHVALGLPPCGFLLWSGLPCPACGLTTSFAHLAHGQLTRAVTANPLGLPLFAITIVLLPWALLRAFRGTSFVHEVERVRADRWALVLALALLVSWAARLAALLT